MGTISPENNKLMLKQLSEYARRLDSMVDEAERDAYSKGKLDEALIIQKIIDNKKPNKEIDQMET